jgi:hypothetical protein
LFQVGGINIMTGNKLYGNTTLRITSNTHSTKTVNVGNNQYSGNLQLEADATDPAANVLIRVSRDDNFSGNVEFILKNNSSISFTNKSHFEKGLFLRNNGTGSFMQDEENSIIYLTGDRYFRLFI